MRMKEWRNRSRRMYCRGKDLILRIPRFRKRVQTEEKGRGEHLDYFLIFKVERTFVLSLKDWAWYQARKRVFINQCPVPINIFSLVHREIQEGTNSMWNFSATQHNYGVYTVSDFFSWADRPNTHLGKSKYNLPNTERCLNTRWFKAFLFQKGILIQNLQWSASSIFLFV